MSFPGQLLIRKINNLTVARYAAAAGIPWVSFCFNKEDASYLSPALAKEIKDWLMGPEYLAEFGNADLESVQTVAYYLEISNVLVTNPAVAEALAKEGFRVWLECNTAPELDAAVRVAQAEQKPCTSGQMAWIMDSTEAGWPAAKADDLVMLPALLEDKTGFVDFESYDLLLEKIGY